MLSVCLKNLWNRLCLIYFSVFSQTPALNTNANRLDPIYCFMLFTTAVLQLSRVNGCKAGLVWLMIKYSCSRVSSHGFFAKDFCSGKLYHYLHWYLRTLKCTGLAFIRSKWFMKVIYSTIQLPSFPSIWMKKEGYLSIFVVGTNEKLEMALRELVERIRIHQYFTVIWKMTCLTCQWGLKFSMVHLSPCLVLKADYSERPWSTPRLLMSWRHYGPAIIWK